MIFSTVPGMVTLGCSEIRAVSRFSSDILADLAMRGFAISFMTLARVALLDSFLRFLCRIHSGSHQEGGNAVPFRTGWKIFARFLPVAARGRNRRLHRAAGGSRSVGIPTKWR